MVPEHPTLPPRVPSGDSCQHPSPRWPPRLAADLTTLKDKWPEPPTHAPTPHRTTDRVRGRGPGAGLESRQCTEVRTEPPTLGPSRAFEGCPTYPAQSSLGTVAGAHGSDREWVRGVGRVTGPSEGAVSPAMAVVPLTAAVPVSVGEGRGGQGARGI